MKKGKIIAGIALSIALLTTLGCDKAKAIETKENHKIENHSHNEEEEHKIHLSKEEIKEFGIKTVKAKSGIIDREIQLPGEISLNTDKTAHISPRVRGKVVDVKKGLGDTVKKGEVLAIISSRELANTKAEYLAQIERLKLAEIVLKREEKLWKKQITSEQEYLEAKNSYTETKIKLTSLKQKLFSFGIDEQELKLLEKNGKSDLTLYPIKAPFNGTILDKHISPGENVSEDSEIFVISDLSTVWAMITVYPKYLNYIDKGQKVKLTFSDGIKDIEGKIDFIAPIVGEETRTSTARVILKNKEGHLKPGMFFTAKIKLPGKKVDIAVPIDAIQQIDGENFVFVKESDYFEAREVEIGMKNHKLVEILKGLKAGEEVVSKGSFTLKAQMTKDTISEGHSH